MHVSILNDAEYVVAFTDTGEGIERGEVGGINRRGRSIGRGERGT